MKHLVLRVQKYYNMRTYANHFNKGKTGENTIFAEM